MASASKNDNNVEKLKVPPHSIEAEQSVLGSMLIDPESWDKVAELVTITIFTIVHTKLSSGLSLAYLTVASL